MVINMRSRGPKHGRIIAQRKRAQGARKARLGKKGPKLCAGLWHARLYKFFQALHLFFPSGSFNVKGARENNDGGFLYDERKIAFGVQRKQSFPR